MNLSGFRVPGPFWIPPKLRPLPEMGEGAKTCFALRSEAPSRILFFTWTPKPNSRHGPPGRVWLSRVEPLGRRTANDGFPGDRGFRKPHQRYRLNLTPTFESTPLRSATRLRRASRLLEPPPTLGWQAPIGPNRTEVPASVPNPDGPEFQGLVPGHLHAEPRHPAPLRHPSMANRQALRRFSLSPQTPAPLGSSALACRRNGIPRPAQSFKQGSQQGEHAPAPRTYDHF